MHRRRAPYPWHPFRERLYRWFAFGGARGKHSSWYQSQRKYR